MLRNCPQNNVPPREIPENPLNLDYSPDELAFREDVRAFLAASLPKPLAAKVHEGKRLTREDFVTWHRILAKKGWVAPGLSLIHI